MLQLFMAKIIHPTEATKYQISKSLMRDNLINIFRCLGYGFVVFLFFSLIPLKSSHYRLIRKEDSIVILYIKSEQKTKRGYEHIRLDEMSEENYVFTSVG